MITIPGLYHLAEAGFTEATNQLIKKLLNNNTPHDQQWIYLAPGGGKSFLRDIMTSPSGHLQRFNKMVCISKLLLAGNIANPTLALQVQWLYMSYHCLDRAKYVESGKVLKNETLETLTAYSQAIHDQKVLDGTLLWQQKQSTRASDDHHNSHKDSSSSSRHQLLCGKTYDCCHDDRRD